MSHRPQIGQMIVCFNPKCHAGTAASRRSSEAHTTQGVKQGSYPSCGSADELLAVVCFVTLSRKSSYLW